MQILTVNCGSSSFRFAGFSSDASLERRFGGKLDRIGSDNATLSFSDLAGASRTELAFDFRHRSAATSAPRKPSRSLAIKRLGKHDL